MRDSLSGSLKGLKFCKKMETVSLNYLQKENVLMIIVNRKIVNENNKLQLNYHAINIFVNVVGIKSFLSVTNHFTL